MKTIRLKKSAKPVCIGVMLTCFILLAFAVCGANTKAVRAAVEEINAPTLIGTKMHNNYLDLELPNNRISVKTASSTQNAGTSINNMFDGKLDTKWEAAWNLSASVEKTLDFTLAAPEFISGFYQSTRMDGQLGSTMPNYIVEYSLDGETFTSHATGDFPYEKGTWFAKFEPIKAKHIRIKTFGGAISEFRLLYVPSSVADLTAMVSEANVLFEKCEAGDAFDTYVKEYYDELVATKSTIEEMPQTSDAEIAAKAIGYLEFVQDIKRGITVETMYIADELALATTYINSAEVGTDPLFWPQEEMDKMQASLDTLTELYSKGYVKQGDFLDAKTKFDRDFVLFKRNTIKPDVKVDSGFVYNGGNNNPLHMIDGIPETRVQLSAKDPINWDGTKFITFDFKGEVQVESFSIASWFCKNQGIKTLKIEFFDATADDGVGDWMPMFAKGQESGNGEFSPDWLSLVDSNQSVSTTMDFNPVKAAKFRFTPLAKLNNFITIDEFSFNVSVNPQDMRLMLSPTTHTMQEYDSFNITAAVTPHYAANKDVLWSSSDDSIATVNNFGTVTAVSSKDQPSAEVTITATTVYGEKTATCVVTVTPMAANPEDFAELSKILSLEEKYAGAAKISDYENGAIVAFNAKIGELRAKLPTLISVGAIHDFKKELTAARDAFDQKSIKAIATVRELIDRVAGAGAGQKFTLTMIPKDEATSRDVWELDWDMENNKPILRGNNAVSLSTAFNYYLKYFCYQELPYTGSYQIDMPDSYPLVTEPIRQVFPHVYRHYFNVNCEYKYSAVNYAEADWRRRIDWFAMNGFNMYLFDFDYRAVWLEMAESGELAGENGDAFAPVDGQPSPAMNELFKATLDKAPDFGNYANDRASIIRSKDLGAKVMKMGFDLGIEPEIRPFYGALPFMFPNNRVDYYTSNKAMFDIDLPNSIFDDIPGYTAAFWMGSPQGVAISPYTVDGVDAEKQAQIQEVFKTLSEKYYEYYMSVYPYDDYGKTIKYVYKDLVEEQGFVINHAAYPRKTLSYLEERFQELNPTGKWLLSSWTIQEWELEYFSRENTLVIDLAADFGGRNAGTNEFWGTDWMWSMLYNYGGNQGIGSNLSKMSSDIIGFLSTKQHMTGFALGPEGSDTDPITYSFISEFTWHDKNVNISQWLRDYAKRRYGTDAYYEAKMEIDSVMNTLESNPYAWIFTKGSPHQSIVNASPKLRNAQARPNGDAQNEHYPYKNMVPVMENMIAAAEKMTNPSPEFWYDFADFNRQILAELALPMYKKIFPAYSAGNIEDAKKYTKMIVDLIGDMDTLLSASPDFLLGTRLEGARNRGATERDKNYFEEIERSFITFWMADNPTPIGGVYDYANKQLGGYLKDYCGMRWQLFYEQLDKASKQPTLPTVEVFENEYQADMRNIITPKIDAWSEVPNTVSKYPTAPVGNILEIGKGILAKYKDLFVELYAIDTTVNKAALQTTYDAYKDNERGDADDISWTEFTKALSVAKAELESGESTYVSVKNALLYLNITMSELSSGVDSLKMQLQIAYNINKDLVQGNYTDESWTILADALNNAKTVLDKADATSEEMQAALDSLNSAKSGLKEEEPIVIPPADKSQLIMQYELCDGLDETKYTEATWAAFKTAYDNAKTVIDDTAATPEQVGAAYANLKTAFEGLVERPAEKRGCGGCGSFSAGGGEELLVP